MRFSEPFITPFDLIMQKTSRNDSERQSLLLVTGAIEQGGRTISSVLRKGPLLGVTGSARVQNVQGEEVQEMDQVGQETFLSLFRRTRAILSVLSEEAEKPEILEVDQTGPLLVAMDPLDGSSNISVNAPVGSIFAVFRPRTLDQKADPEKLFLESASSMILSAYLLYSVSTSLVLSVGDETHIFTLDPDSGEYRGTGEPWRFPENGKIYSTNEAYFPLWESALQEYTSWIKAHRKPPLTLRYIGALVADFHRNLLKGGIYIYPAETGEKGRSAGKLRLLYEAYPMAFIAKNAGGSASDGKRSILSISPHTIHQRVPLVVGPADMVSEFHDRTGNPFLSS